VADAPIRGAVLHLENEQPLVVDIYRMPEASDVGLICTNVRTLNGKRPVFVDDITSVFFFPYRVIRFLEVLPRSTGAESGRAAAVVPAEPGEGADSDADLELDEDLLRRVREI
jgi:hypothetical protein